jgi:magnesium transporter
MDQPELLEVTVAPNGAAPDDEETTKADTAGLSPGTLVYVGEKRTTPVRVTVTDYAPDSFQVRAITYLEECLAYRETPSNTWIDVDAVHDITVVRQLGELFNIDPLVLEDIVDTEQRPRLDDYGSYLFIILKMTYQSRLTQETVIEQVSLIVGDHYVLSFQERNEGDAFVSVRRRLRAGLGRIRTMGPDYLAYALMDAIVDNYFIVLEKFNDEIEELQEELYRNTDADIPERLHELERKLSAFRKAVWPLRESIGLLSRERSSVIRKGTHKYIRDLSNNVVQVIDATELSLDQLGRLHNLYLARLSHRMNEIIKVLTLVSAIFIPLTFIVGVYGMNFDEMPELRSPLGYPGVLLFMAATAGLMLLYFKRKRWL